MAKNNQTPIQFKVKNKAKVDELTKAMGELDDSDKGAVLRNLNITFLQSRWRPLLPTPELRPLINGIGRLSTLINLVMKLFTSRRMPIEDLDVISETRIREDVVEPITEIIQNKCREIEEVLNRNKERPQGKDKGKAKGKTPAKAEKSAPETVEDEDAAAKPELVAQA